MMLRFMRGAIVVCGLAVLAAGCSARSTTWLFYPHSGTETLTQSGDEHFESVYSVARQDRRAIAEDFDLLFQTDRPTRLTRWHDR